MGARDSHFRCLMLRSTPIFRRALVRPVMAVTLAVAAAGHNAPAQRLVPPAGLTPRGSAQLTTAAALPAAERDSLAHAAVSAGTDRLRTVAGYTLLGGAAGAAAGFAYAYVNTISRNYSDHSEDGFAYMVCGVAGAAAGLVVGGIVGLVRSSPERNQPRTAAE